MALLQLFFPVNCNLQLCKLQELLSQQKLLVNASPTELNKFFGYESVDLCIVLMYYLHVHVHVQYYHSCI